MKKLVSISIFLIIPIFTIFADMYDAPEDRDIWFEAFRLRGDWGKIDKLIDGELKQDPKNPSANYAKAYFLAQRARYEESIPFYKLAIKYGYEFIGEAYFYLGCSFYGLWMLDEALDAYDAGIKHGYDHRTIFHMRNQVRIALGHDFN